MSTELPSICPFDCPGQAASKVLMLLSTVVPYLKQMR